MCRFPEPPGLNLIDCLAYEPGGFRLFRLWHSTHTELASHLLHTGFSGASSVDAWNPLHFAGAKNTPYFTAIPGTFVPVWRTMSTPGEHGLLHLSRRASTCGSMPFSLLNLWCSLGQPLLICCDHTSEERLLAHLPLYTHRLRQLVPAAFVAIHT